MAGSLVVIMGPRSTPPCYRFTATRRLVCHLRSGGAKARCSGRETWGAFADADESAESEGYPERLPLDFSIVPDVASYPYYNEGFHFRSPLADPGQGGHP